MSKELYAIGGYGPCRIIIGADIFYFNVAPSTMEVIEEASLQQNYFGNYVKNVRGYHISFEMNLVSLHQSDDISETIDIKNGDIFNFLNKYHTLNTQDKAFYISPRYTNGLNVVNNRTVFKVITDGPPIAQKIKQGMDKFGEILTFKAFTVDRISPNSYQYIYRNTKDGTWSNVGSVPRVEFKIDGSDVDASVRDASTDVEFDNKTGGQL